MKYTFPEGFKLGATGAGWQWRARPTSVPIRSIFRT